MPTASRHSQVRQGRPRQTGGGAILDGLAPDDGVDVAGFGPVSVVLRDERGQDPRALAQKELRFDCDALLQGLQEEEYVMLQVETVDRVSRPLREAGAGGRPPSQPPRQPRPQLSSKGGPQ